VTKKKTIKPEELTNELPLFLRELNPELYLSDNYVVLDFETTILDKGSPYNKDNSIVCSSWVCGRGHKDYDSHRVKYHKGNEFQQDRLVRAVESADFWVAHNSKFEYGWLERCGVPLESTLAFCTMLAEYVLLSNRGNPSMLSLERCLQRRRLGGKEVLGKKLLAAEVCPSTWPERWLKPYSLADSVAGERLFLDQRKALAQQGRLGVCLTRNIFTAPLVDIEKNGMHLDPVRSLILQKKYHGQLQDLREKIDKVTGGANPASPPQMREVVFEKLKFPKPRDTTENRRKGLISDSGEPSVGAEALLRLKPKTNKQRLFIKLKSEYSKVNAALTKCLNKFAECIEQSEDRILTASMNQAITVTQRLSSTGKNYKAQFQNFARIFKPLFSARKEGWLIGEIDQAQLEYRVAVWYGQDKNGMADIANRVDAHSFTASIVFKGEWEHITPKSSEWDEKRTEAKKDTFKPLYGGQSGTPRQVAYYKAFQKKHNGITEAQNLWKRSAVNDGKVTIPSGLTFYFPNTRILEDGYITNSTNICNYPVQSLATADIVPIGVVYQWHLMRLAKLESFLVNTVHDSTIGEVHPDEVEDYTAIGEYAHVDCVYNYLSEVYKIDFNVPLEIEAKFGEHWAEPKGWEEKYLY
jgi:DNA polymerase I-like protein with 3'-5' exonuclease and polymerase domains